MNNAYRFMILGAVLLLSGCKVDLYSNLSEADANQMLALLASNQIDGAKKTDKSGSLVLQVEKSDFVKAVEVLRQSGYPRRAYRSVDELFPSGQLVSSPAQEQAKILFLREQSLERMLSNIEGVISANVVIGGDVGDDGDKTGTTPSASVLVKYTPEVNLRSLSGQLKNLIHNALPGVSQEHISLIVQAVDYRFAASVNNDTDALPASSHAPLAAAHQSIAAASAVPIAKKNELAVVPIVHIDSQKSTGVTGIPLWSLLVFWLLSTMGIIWHGVRKQRRKVVSAVVHGE